LRMRWCASHTSALPWRCTRTCMSLTQSGESLFCFKFKSGSDSCGYKNTRTCMSSIRSGVSLFQSITAVRQLSLHLI
jgi:hypothetical protein